MDPYIKQKIFNNLDIESKVICQKINNDLRNTFNKISILCRITVRECDILPCYHLLVERYISCNNDLITGTLNHLIKMIRNNLDLSNYYYYKNFASSIDDIEQIDESKSISMLHDPNTCFETACEFTDFEDIVKMMVTTKQTCMQHKERDYRITTIPNIMKVMLPNYGLKIVDLCQSKNIKDFLLKYYECFLYTN